MPTATPAMPIPHGPMEHLNALFFTLPFPLGFEQWILLCICISLLTMGIQWEHQMRTCGWGSCGLVDRHEG